ncbi:MAG TPA: primosomal protein N' [Candidatus Binatia bacterium]|nr:primosomal protein N' [Candidatus Binatia bacterium]
MHYYEVLVADSFYHGSTPLIYGYSDSLPRLSVVSMHLRNRLVTGFVLGKVPKPDFEVKQIKGLLSDKPLPNHCIELARWLKDYYGATLGEALRQFAPSVATVKRGSASGKVFAPQKASLDLDSPLTAEQKTAIESIKASPGTTVLLHGDTGSGKTRVYLELAKQVISNGRSAIILTPEIALTSQLEAVAGQKISAPIYIMHSQLTVAQRKKIWFEILEADEPMLVIGPRSALFTPVARPGLIVVDEAHEPAYKQESAPRYNTIRVASQLGLLTSSRVVLGSATPSVSDYYLAMQKDAIVRMRMQAKTERISNVDVKVIDQRDRANFRRNRYISDQLIDDITTTLKRQQQVMIYYNRRGSARLILCENCGWHLACPNCDIPLVYHADSHEARCHTCGFKQSPPSACPNCGKVDVIYKSIGTKALVEIIEKLFPGAKVGRFDSDSISGERLNEVYEELYKGNVDILVGTQQLAKGLDLPKLSLVGIISAETSLSLPDFTAEERAFQLLYQVIGRVGRGHSGNKVVIQAYEPDSWLINSASSKDYQTFYEKISAERQRYLFPPYCYLLKLVCKRTTSAGAKQAADKLKRTMADKRLPVEIIGPAPSFYGRRGNYFYWQLVVKAKRRNDLLDIISLVPSGWSIDLDPKDLL